MSSLRNCAIRTPRTSGEQAKPSFWRSSTISLKAKAATASERKSKVVTMRFSSGFSRRTPFLWMRSATPSIGGAVRAVMSGMMTAMPKRRPSKIGTGVAPPAGSFMSVVAAIPAMIRTTSQRGTMPAPMRSAPVGVKPIAREGMAQPASLPMMAISAKTMPTPRTDGSPRTRMSTSMPIVTKKTGTRKALIGWRTVRMRNATSVWERDSPMTKAPTIMARPAFSKRPATSSAKPKARVGKAAGALKSFSRLAMRRERIRPSAVTPSQMAKLRIVMVAIDPQFMLPPRSSMPAMPTTTARQTMPSTSSMTAAAMIVTPSGEPMAFCSDRIRAEMPTLVAVQRMPRKRVRGSVKDQCRT